MGQATDQQDLHEDARKHSPRKALRRYVPTLAAAVGIACAALAHGRAQDSTAFDSAKAWDYLVKQVDFGPRKPGTEAHAKCQDFMVDEMKKYCDNVRLQPFTHNWSKTHETISMNNVIGEQDYKDAPVKVALFAHWDTRPSADQETDPERQAQPIPGADDGASGVALLLELMKELKGKHPGIGIQYVMIDGEDLGPGEDEMYLGAVYYARHLPTPKPDYGILLDMIAGKNVRIPKEVNSAYGAPNVTKLLFLHAQKIGLSSTFPDTQGMVIDDDHIPLIKAGVPTVDLIDLTYPQWHTLSDTPENCSADSLGKVGTLMKSFLLSKDALAAAK